MTQPTGGAFLSSEPTGYTRYPLVAEAGAPVPEPATLLSTKETPAARPFF